jgi:hypothetical protein
LSATEFASTSESEIVSGWPSPLRSTSSSRRQEIGVSFITSMVSMVSPAAQR